MSLIQDREQFNNFIDILPDLQNDEVYFISLSARNKYLTKEEREFYGLGRTEMFARNIVRNKYDFEYVLSKLESALTYKLTKNKQKIPEKALVIYININPSSMIKAYFNLMQEMNKEMNDITIALQHDKQPNYSGIHLLDRKLMNCIQRARSRKVYIDIDFDISLANVHLVATFESLLRKNSIDFNIIKTKSGYHVLIDLESMNNKKFNLNKIIIELNEEAKNNGGEIIINSNGMVPFPGTLQAGELVKIL